MKTFLLQLKSRLADLTFAGKLSLALFLAIPNLVTYAAASPLTYTHGRAGKAGPALNYGRGKFKSKGGTTSMAGKRAALAPPSLSYSTPNIYYTNQTITPLQPVASGVSSPGYSSSAVAVGSGFSSPYGVAVDTAGNVYVADQANHLVKKIQAGTGTTVSIGTGFSLPAGIAVDVHGNVFVTDAGDNSVKKISAADGSTTTLATGFNQPLGITVLASGFLYVADSGNNVIKDIYPVSNFVSTAASGFNTPTAVAIDSTGNIFVCDYGTNSIKKSYLNTITTVVSGLNAPLGIAIDGLDNIFVSDASNNAVKMVAAGTSVAVAIGPGFSNPHGVAVSSTGAIYVGDFANNAVKRIDPVGGYYINRSLPAGLNFNSATGVVSGTPTAVTAASYYIITAYNADGGTSATVGIQTIRSLAPAVSYATPQSYYLNQPITPLQPTASGVAAPGYSSSSVTVGSGFSSPYGVAIDSVGNVYVADQANHLVKKIYAGTGTIVNIGTGFSLPAGIALDKTGNVYVTDDGDNTVKVIAAADGSTSTMTTGFKQPAGIVYDAANGHLYVADSGNKVIKQLTPGFTDTFALSVSFTTPAGVTVDANGQLYVCDYGANNIVKFFPGGLPETVVSSGLNKPINLVVDPFGNLYVTDSGNNAVKLVTAGSSTGVAIGAGFSNPHGVAVTQTGQVYVGDFGNNAVKRIDPVGGYIISRALPAGLTLNGTTGIITGTPTKVTAATQYIITAYNANGGTSDTVSIATKLPPLPTLNYSTPQTYYTGTAIAPLTPASTNVQSMGYGQPRTITTFQQSVTAVAVDAVGNVYSTSILNDNVRRTPLAGGAPVDVGSGFSDPNGVAVDKNGTVFVADYSNNAVKQVYNGTSTPSTIWNGGFDKPGGVAVDLDGNVLITDYTANTLIKVSNFDGHVTTLATGFNRPYGIALDAAGNYYIANHGTNQIMKVPAGGGTPVVVVSGLSGPIGIALDALGNIYTANSGDASIKEIPAGGGTPINLAYAYQAYGVAIDGKGNIFYNDNAFLYELTPSGGYYLDNPLPPGLSFDRSTGIFSGIPTAVNTGANYTVTAYNIAGSASATINIWVRAATANASLQNLTANTGTLSPAFATNVTGYTIAVPNAVTSITLTPTTSASAATVTVAGSAVTSGTASQSIPLTVGANNINTVVTAQDGATTKTYSVVVTRSSSPNAKLTKITVNTGTALTEVSGPGYKNFTTTVPNTTTSVNVIPTTQDAGATIKVNGVTVASGTPSSSIPLSVGHNVITTVVTAQDGVTSLSYIITITRAGSSNALLTKIATNSGVALTPVTGPDYKDYAITVPNSLNSITVTPTTQDATATVTVNGTTVASGTASPTITLTVGANVINTVVTAQDGVTTKTYGITVTKPGSSNANLAGLATSTGSISPAFSASITSYTMEVAYTTQNISLTPTLADPSANVTVNGQPVTSGTASPPVYLNIGTNTIQAVVHAQDGSSTKTYTLVITRDASNNALLKSIRTTPFDTLNLITTQGASYRDYATVVPNSQASIQLTSVPLDTTATIKVNGVTVASGALSQSIPLAVGRTYIQTVVTAGDGVTVKSYGIAVIRISNNALLTKISTNSGVPLTTVSGPDYRDYTISVPNSTSTITITPTTQDSTATVKVNGATVASGTASPAIPLQIGNTTITTVVTAQDGTTTKTYGITVTRAAMMALYVPKDSVATDGLTVHPGITPNGDGINDIFTIDGINAFPDNKVTIMGRSGAVIFEAKGYDNQTKFFDGHSNKNGSLQLPGTYFYSLEYVADGKSKVKTGFIVIKY